MGNGASRLIDEVEDNNLEIHIQASRPIDSYVPIVKESKNALLSSCRRLSDQEDSARNIVPCRAGRIIDHIQASLQLFEKTAYQQSTYQPPQLPIPSCQDVSAI